MGSSATSAQANRLIEAFKTRLHLENGEGISKVLSRLVVQDYRKVQAPEPQSLEVLGYLAESLKEVSRFDVEIAVSIADLAPFLRWMRYPSYSDELLGEGFNANFGYCEIIGSNGFYPGNDFLMGLLLLGPRTHFLDHAHEAPELYWPLTGGSLWRMGDSDFVERAAGDVIWHPANVAHATKTLAKPLLTWWSYTRDTGALAHLV